MKPVNANADFCGRVPLHQTNSIQPHGVLLVVEKESGRILQASENADRVFGRSVKELVTVNLTEVATAGAEDLQSLLQMDLTEKLALQLQVDGRSYAAGLQQQDDYCLLEIDLSPLAESEPSVVPLFREIAAVQSAVNSARSTEEACVLVVEELKKLSGFDKVMVYRFDEDWNGDVIAEAAEPGMDRYLGLRFPASDIPAQARELYKRSPYRFIPTIDYEPVKLYPVLNPKTHAFTNLSNASLRSVAGVHIEYLRNMQVAASMSTRILVNGVLWGLIACHHRTPKYLSYRTCAAFELLSGAIAAKINTVQATDALADHASRQQLLLQVVEAVHNRREVKGLLLQLLEADGIAWVREERIETEGATPGQSEVADLVDWLRAGDEGVVHEPQISAVYEPAESYAATASGLLALPINRHRAEYLLAFRPEAVQKIVWSGNPEETIRFEKDGKGYHPRASFKQWQQTVRNRALPWRAEVVQLAAELGNFLAALRPMQS